jgi:hypothetical protein
MASAYVEDHEWTLDGALAEEQAHKIYRTLELAFEMRPIWCPENLQPSSAKGKMDCTLDLLPQ